jgi:hypothetical protein
VTTVINGGVAYFSAAINNGNLHSNHSGTYEGDFIPYSQKLSDGSTFNVFSGSDIGNQILSDTSFVNLFWSDPLGKSSNNYDLYVTDIFLSIVASSTNPQTGTQDPYEAIGVNGDLLGYYVVILNPQGLAAPRFLHLEVGRSLLNYATNGATKGHPTLEAAYGVAATEAGGRTTPFTGSEPVETFSSDGPRRVFYNPDGSAITLGNLSSTGGKLSYKPDITAADGVKTSANPTSGAFNPFHGTSAAAPHPGPLRPAYFPPDLI